MFVLTEDVMGFVAVGIISGISSLWLYWQHITYTSEENVSPASWREFGKSLLEFGKAWSLYQPLDFDQNEIRLLAIDWSAEENTPISCSLEHASLIDPKTYIALSYRWGDPNITKPLWIRSSSTLQVHNLDITVNLDLAIRSLRKHFKNGSAHLSPPESPLCVWIDAICINQKDWKERSLQVRNMRQVYATAHEVVAWVGPVTGSPTSMEEGLPYSTKLADLIGATSFASTDRTELPEMHSGFKNILELFFHPYWQRVWIIQEITVAPNVSVLYGDQLLSWDQLQRLLSELEEQQKIPAKNLSNMNLPLHLIKFHDRYADQVRNPIGLLDALMWSRRSQATDPRDKIFALLGLCHDGPTYVPIPNYKQPVESIIADMSKKMMMLNRTLDFTFIRSMDIQIPDTTQLPTWASDWQALWLGSGLSRVGKRIIDDNGIIINSTNPILPGSSTGILRVQGMCSGIVENMTSPASLDLEGTPQIKSNTLDPLGLMPSYLLVSVEPDFIIRQILWMMLRPTINYIISPSPYWIPNFGRYNFAYRRWFVSLWYPDELPYDRSREPSKFSSWANENAEVEIKGRTLKQWAKLLLESEDWSISDQNLHMSTDEIELQMNSGMRLAVLRRPVLENRDAEKGQPMLKLAMVPPQTEISDGSALPGWMQYGYGAKTEGAAL